MIICMRTPEVKKFIEDHQHLFWYSPAPKSETVSDELLVETLLNYGSLAQIQTLFDLMSMREVAKIFFHSINLSKRRKNNFFEPTVNYFTLFFNRYAN